MTKSSKRSGRSKAATSFLLNAVRARYLELYTKGVTCQKVSRLMSANPVSIARIVRTTNCSRPLTPELLARIEAVAHLLGLKITVEPLPDEDVPALKEPTTEDDTDESSDIDVQDLAEEEQ